MKIYQSLLVLPLLMLAACETTPEVEEAPIVIAPIPVQTCTPIQELERVVIPAKTEKFYAITEIENPPYEPITRREERVKVVEEEKVFYVDATGKEVTDICDDEPAPVGEATEG